jgi:hypothetical protein
MTNSVAISTRIPAAALSRNARLGFEVHWKICIGSAVYLASTPSGPYRMNATAPTTTSGAVSPIARAIARIAPVRMPGSAIGSTTCRVHCQRVAPSPAPPRAGRP